MVLIQVQQLPSRASGQTYPKGESYGKSTIAIIIIITVISFALEKLPLAVTALASSLAMGITGAMDLTDIYSGFGSTTVMMVVGMMIIGDALFKTGIAEKMGKKVLGSGLVKSEEGFLVMTVALAGVLSAFLSNTAVIALMGACILFAFRVVDFQESMGELDWNTVVILGAAQGFAKGLDASGGGSLIANSMIGLFGNNASPFVIYGVLVVITIILTNFMSNTAATAMLVPIALEIAFTLGANPITFTLGIVVAAHVALATPIGTTSVGGGLPIQRLHQDRPAHFHPVRRGHPHGVLLFLGLVGFAKS